MIKCIGCGATLQNQNENQEGYTKDLEKDYCQRCFQIIHYNKYQYINKDNKYYLDIINKIDKTNDLVLLVTDFLNTESLNEIKINNDVILVLAKRDLIPYNINENKILSNIKTKLNIVSKIAICAKNNYNLDELMNQINKHKKTKNVYIIGYTNAGKSTLINKIIKNYGNNNHKITTSILPSTTLDLIETKINDDLTIIDTPGLLDKGSIILNSEPKQINKILPKSEIKPKIIQAKVDQTIIIENLIRLDVKQGTNLIFYMSNQLELNRYYKNVDTLKEYKKENLIIEKNHDLVIKGLGFIKITKPAQITIYTNNVNYSVRASIL